MDTLSGPLSWIGHISESKLSATEKLVALTLSLSMNEAAESPFPGTKTLAARCSLDESVVKQVLASMEESGWMKWRADGPDEILDVDVPDYERVSYTEGE